MSEPGIIHDPPNATVDIILVHGWRGDQQPWTQVSGDKSLFWPKDLLSASTPQARIIAFEYDANIDRFWNRESEIDLISFELLSDLREKRSTSDTTKRPIIFVAHSIGGLVCQSGLVRVSNGSKSDRELANCVRCIAFLGTPSLGDSQEEQWSKIGENFFKLSGKTPEGDLKEKSKELATTGREFQDLLKSRSETTESIEVACFYEGLPTQLDGKSIKIVEQSATGIPDCPRPIPLRANHQGMCAFKGGEDEKKNYELVSKQLAHWARELVVEADGESKGGIASNATINGPNYGFNLGTAMAPISGFRFERPQS